MPDAAPVRQKTLFAATRLTLVRALGADAFADTAFVTAAEELTAEGWARRLRSESATERPLTEEERNLEGIKAEEARQGTAGSEGRRAHVSSGVGLPVDEEALDALRELGGVGGGRGGGLVQLVR